MNLVDAVCKRAEDIKVYSTNDLIYAGIMGLRDDPFPSKCINIFEDENGIIEITGIICEWEVFGEISNSYNVFSEKVDNSVPNAGELLNAGIDRCLTWYFEEWDMTPYYHEDEE